METVSGATVRGKRETDKSSFQHARFSSRGNARNAPGTSEKPDPCWLPSRGFVLNPVGSRPRARRFADETQAGQALSGRPHHGPRTAISGARRAPGTSCFRDRFDVGRLEGRVGAERRAVVALGGGEVERQTVHAPAAPAGQVSLKRLRALRSLTVRSPPLWQLAQMRSISSIEGRYQPSPRPRHQAKAGKSSWT